jgi:hypothetical protein
MLRTKKNRSEWLWLLFFFLTAGCELTVDNIDFERHMTDDLVNSPRHELYAEAMGGRFWAAPYIEHVRQAQFRPERVCRYWHAAQAAWRMECGGVHPDLFGRVEGSAVDTAEQSWSIYTADVEVECSPDWIELPWREVEGLALCAELIIDSPCEHKADLLMACRNGELPIRGGPVRPV